MANFSYRARDKNGLLHVGEIESTDDHQAAAVLRKKGLVVINLVLLGKKSEFFLLKMLNKVSFNELVNITRQLATMIGAGLVLSEAIDILEEQQTNKRLKDTLTIVSSDIKGGLTLSAAFGKHPDVFPSLYVNLVKSGESSGKLDQVLLRMADSLEKEREFRARVKGALIYPAVVVSMMVVVIFIMMTFVIPRLISLYRDSQIELPLPTRILITVSDFFVGFWWLIIIIFIAAIIALRRWMKTPHGALMVDAILLKSPVVGRVISNVTLTNFNRTFGMLVSAGVPILDSINIVTEVTENMVFKNALRESYAGVERGLPFSVLLNNPIFPRIVGQMIKVGEETGKVDEIFFKLADYFESESDHLVKNLTVAIEPIVLVTLGLGVAFLVISIILPIYKITTSF